MPPPRPLLRALQHPPPSPPVPRLYHSHEHPPPPPFPPAETAILSAALTHHVPTLGFTTHALRAGARTAGYLDATTNLFPTGALALLNYHLVTARLALAHHHHHTPSPNIPATLRSLVLRRLHLNTPFLPHYPAALALLATPRHLPVAIRELALLADEMLFLAGSAEVGSGWYVDRAGVAAVYASAELFMTQDRSGGFVETEAFLERRLEEAGRVRGGVGMVGRWVGGQVGGVVDGLRSKGVRI